VLARFVDCIELDGAPATLFERPPGQPLAGKPPTEAIAGALAQLHEEFGLHGALCPQTIWTDGDTVTFVDPIPYVPMIVIGAVGFTLPMLASDPTDMRDEKMLVRDVAAFAATIAEVRGTPLDWKRHQDALLASIRHPKFAQDWLASRPLDDVWDRLVAKGDVVLAAWIQSIARIAFMSYLDAPPPRGTARSQLGFFTEGLTQSRLEAFLFRLPKIRERVRTSPSLLDFLAAETVTPKPDFLAAFREQETCFATLVRCVGDLRFAYVGAFGELDVVPLPEVQHPEQIWEESRVLRTLLLDLEKLIDPGWYTATTLGEVGGYFARMDRCIEHLRDKDKLYMALRRYTHVLS
jgi:hypothetical protein